MSKEVHVNISEAQVKRDAKGGYEKGRSRKVKMIEWTYEMQVQELPGVPAVRVETLEELAAEINRARKKFPRNTLLYTALGEEFGELGKALLQEGNGPSARREALQVACVALRILEEGDPVYDNLDSEARQP
jgi:hypothetical protein